MLEDKKLPVTIYEKQRKINLVKLLGHTLTDFFGSHFLALQLTRRDVSAQYRQSYFGILWLFITPLASAAIWVFLNSSGTITLTDTGIPYPVYAFSGTLIWSILLESINAPMASTNAARGIISKINFPKEALVLSGIYKLLFNSSFKVLLLVVFIFVFGVGFHWSLLLLPLVLVMAVVFGTSLGLLITPIGLLYSDVSRLISMGLSLLMYITPVVYSIPKTGIMKTIMTYNPFTPFILTIRDVAVGGSPEFLNYFIGLTGLGIALFFIGLVIYRVSIPVIVERLSA
jgi:lipopolysaccharide transport system permease protein